MANGYGDKPDWVGMGDRFCLLITLYSEDLLLKAIRPVEEYLMVKLLELLLWT